MNSVPNMEAPLFKSVLHFFQFDEWIVEPVEGQTILKMGFQGENGSWICYAQTIEEQQVFLFYSILESSVPDSKLLPVAEYLMRVNCLLSCGNFEIDFSDGEIRFRTSVDVEGGELTSEMVKNVVYSNIAIMDRYLPGIMNVMYSDMTPTLALEKIENEAVE